ncbi:hypothetical protein [Stakelama tenebrarum]|uniref:Uncharacterized protein n=1 Tax=Stakelama tenebrarum TaxID=2711215 RepID=A0A6G6Y5G0_9SPHN|nr:hypothetical protein [Sphingosinithalassobacter tenebrarum]QIG79958.1 hypothetical protein G5C33_09345 [Sphingosinithalassobacter tenebrarum]
MTDMRQGIVGAAADTLDRVEALRSGTPITPPAAGTRGALIEAAARAIVAAEVIDAAFGGPEGEGR